MLKVWSKRFGLPCGPSSCPFLRFLPNKGLFMLFWPTMDHFSSNFTNITKIKKKVTKKNIYIFFKKYLKGRKKFPLNLPFKEINLCPELSSPTRFRIQGGPMGVTERRKDRGRTKILVSNIGNQMISFKKTFKNQIIQNKLLNPKKIRKIREKKIYNLKMSKILLF